MTSSDHNQTGQATETSSPHTPRRRAMVYLLAMVLTGSVGAGIGFLIADHLYRSRPHTITTKHNGEIIGRATYRYENGKPSLVHQEGDPGMMSGFSVDWGRSKDQIGGSVIGGVAGLGIGLGLCLGFRRFRRPGTQASDSP